MSSRARQPNDSGKSVAAFPISELSCEVESPVVHNANRFTAFRFEFVAKPEEASHSDSIRVAGFCRFLRQFGDALRLGKLA